MMGSLDDWRALLRDVEAATVPDIGINMDMATALGWTIHRPKFDPHWLDPDGKPADGLPDWTASLDAIVALVDREMPGHTRKIEATPSVCRAALWAPPNFEEIAAGRADREEALALLAAFIRTRIAEMERTP